MDWEHNEDFLIHYGVKGQKWGERRYRNEDGSLTAEGRAHYGIGKRIFGGGNVRRGFASWREKRRRVNLEKAKAKGNERKIEKYQSKLDAQKKANDDMAAYMKDKTGVGLYVQNRIAIGHASKKALHRYRKARARGQSGISALITTAMLITGRIIAGHYNKKKYGKRIVWSGLDEKVSNIL